MAMELKRKLEIPRIDPKELRWECDPECIGFLTTDEVVATREIVGQERGVEALRVGLEIEGEGYNIYVCGAAGTGRSTAVRRLLEELSRERPTPDDICYVNNFKDPDSPKVLYLPPGEGAWFKEEMHRVIEALRTKVPKVFESDVYQERRKTIVDRVRGQEKSLYKEFEKKIAGEGFSMVVIPMGPVSRTELLPVIEGQPVAWEQLEAQVEEGQFPQETLDSLRTRYEELMHEMQERILKVRDLEQELQEKIRTLDREMVGPVVAEEMGVLRSRIKRPKALAYLEEAQQYMLDHLDMFRPTQEGPPQALLGQDPFSAFTVNLVVDNSDTKGAPVIFESYPTYRNLFGSIERVFDPRGGGGINAKDKGKEKEG
jgi:ATP-dependent Lon protease